MTARRRIVCTSLLTWFLPACYDGPPPGDRPPDVSNRPAHTHAHDAARTVQWPTKPPPKLAQPAPAPSPGPGPEVAAEDELAKEKQALADVGSAAFDALRSGNFDDLLALTHFRGGALATDCPEMPGSGNKREAQARFDHCHEQIPWDEVVDAQIFAGKPTGKAAAGCKEGLEDYGRLNLYVHLEDQTIWRVDFFGAVGRDGQAVGVDGAVSCRTVDEAPAL